MVSLEQHWQALFDRVFADFSDELILSEARGTLEAMDYQVEQDGERQTIPHSVSLLIVRRSLHHDPDTRLGGYLTFDVAVGPHFTKAGRFNGLCDYGMIRLEFGLDGTFQDETFTPSPLGQSEEPAPEFPVEMASTVLAEPSEEYKVRKESNEPE
jgi:hypothetical protein